MSATGTPETKVIAGTLHRVRHGRGKRFSAEPPPGPEHRPARVAVMLAFAHKIKRAIERGEIRGQADAARDLGLTRARLTQMLDLTLLAPGLQEKILFLEAVGGVEPLSERLLRDVVRIPVWRDQKGVFHVDRADSPLPPVLKVSRSRRTSLSQNGWTGIGTKIPAVTRS